MKLYTIQADVWLTRRKRVHFILTANDDLCYTAGSITEALNWLYDLGEERATLNTEDRAYVIELRPRE